MKTAFYVFIAFGALNVPKAITIALFVIGVITEWLSIQKKSKIWINVINLIIWIIVVILAVMQLRLNIKDLISGFFNN